MTLPVASATILTDAIKNLYLQFQNSPNLTAFVTSYAIQVAELETEAVRLWVYCTLPYAADAQLDLLGKIVGEGRAGRSDADYRIAIAARIKINKTSGKIEDIIEAMTTADSAATSYEITDLGYASVIVRRVGAIGSVDPYLLDNIVQEIKGGGIDADFVYSEEDDSDTLQFSSSDVEEADANAGLANDAGTVGGSFAEVI